MILLWAKQTEYLIILIHVMCDLPNQNTGDNINNFLYLSKYTYKEYFNLADLLVWPYPYLAIPVIAPVFWFS